MKAPSILTQYDNKSDVLVITFGGLANKIGMPVFEFFNLLDRFAVDKLFVRDFHQSWYLKGLPDIGDRVDDIAAYLKGVIADNRYAKTVCIGNSAGGFAALLFGGLIGADLVLSFSPQTFVDLPTKLFKFDFRFIRKYRRNLFTEPNRAYANLKRTFERIGYNVDTYIYYSRNHRMDVIHAGQLASFPNVRLVAMEDNSHKLIQNLKKNGSLPEIIESHFKTVA